MEDEKLTTLERIHRAAKEEFLRKGFKTASLRNIVKSLEMTTGAFYGYYKSKEDLFEALVGEEYNYILDRFKASQEELLKLPKSENFEDKKKVFYDCMSDILHFAENRLEECNLILTCAQGTRFSNLIDELVEIEVDKAAFSNKALKNDGDFQIDARLEHILVTGMFNTFFELIIHKIPIKTAEVYLYQMQEFYFAGWKKLLDL